jgi:transcriptional regulator with AAA-type ATPase domain
MNPTHSIDQAHSSSLRGTVAAMTRAAQQARRIAAQTQTAVVVERNGVLEHLHAPSIHASETPSLQAIPTKKDH